MVTITLDTDRLAQGKAPFRVIDGATGKYFFAPSRKAAEAAAKFYKKGFDIMALLWQDNRSRIIAALTAHSLDTKNLLRYKLIYTYGEDSGVLSQDGKPIGEVYVDWGEPSLEIKFY